MCKDTVGPNILSCNSLMQPREGIHCLTHALFFETLQVRLVCNKTCRAELAQPWDISNV